MITTLLYHKYFCFQLFLRNSFAVSHRLSLNQASSKNLIGPGVFQTNSTGTLTHHKPKSKCYLHAGTIFSLKRRDDGNFSQKKRAILQRLRRVSQWSPWTCFLILHEQSTLRSADIWCLPHQELFTCILETTSSTWNRSPLKFPAVLLSIFQSVLRGLSSSTLLILTHLVREGTNTWHNIQTPLPL